MASLVSHQILLDSSDFQSDVTGSFKLLPTLKIFPKDDKNLKIKLFKGGRKEN